MGDALVSTARIGPFVVGTCGASNCRAQGPVALTHDGARRLAQNIGFQVVGGGWAESVLLCSAHATALREIIEERKTAKGPT